MDRGAAKAEKERIRREVRAAAETLDPAGLREAGRAITRRVLALPAWQKARTVMAYVSMPAEPDTRELMETALREGKTLLLPRCVDRERMTALPVKDLSGLVRGRLGIPEPPEAEENATVPEPDLILVPCMAASPQGIRLGHGAGYYDRFLSERRGEKVCLCFRVFLRADLPAEDTDVPMDLVVTD